jgi:hypothetical protein
MLSSLNACIIIARVSVALVPRFAQNLIHTRSLIQREITQLQIKGHKIQHIHSGA